MTPEALLDIKLYWGTGPYSFPFFSFKVAAHNALGYRNSPRLTHTTVQGRMFNVIFGGDINRPS